MIDRPIRPLFPKGWHFETQLVAQPLSVDHVHPYDILAMNGASAALAISPIPVAKYVGAVRIGKLDGDFVVKPEEETLPELEMDLIVSGSDEAILMVECGADGVTEAEVLDALDIAHAEMQTLIGAMEELRSKVGEAARSRSRRPRIDAEADPRRSIRQLTRTGARRCDRHRGQARALRRDRRGQGSGGRRSCPRR